MPDLTPLSRRPILILGRAGMDLYADPPGTRAEEAARFTTALGGSSANIAAALARMGLQTALLTTVSDDAIGRFVLNQLDHFGIDRRHVTCIKGEARTSLALVETRLHDTQSVLYRNAAADFAMTTAQVDAVDFTRFSALVATGTALAADPSRSATFHALARARAAGLPVIFDIDYRPYSWPAASVARDCYARACALCDVVVGNDVEFGILAADPGLGLTAARSLATTTAQIVVYKMGEAGAVTLTPDGEFATGIYPTAALKPTGAGDAFMGSFLAALATGHNLRDAVLRGSAAAAMVVARIGCAPAMPDRSELDAFLAAHPGPTPA